MISMGTPRHSMSMTACVFLLSIGLAPGVGWTADKLGVLYSALSVSYSMPWIARESGLFRKYNLDVDLVYIPSSGVANAALLGGDVEVALAGGIGTVRASNGVYHRNLAGSRI
jgi:ABC-type nitrate/sulfonate/bicarbonate transport system substrate-binding protein